MREKMRETKGKKRIITEGEGEIGAEIEREDPFEGRKLESFH